MIALPDVIPASWKLGAALAIAAALAGAGVAYHHHAYQQGFDGAVDQRAARDGVAIVTRLADNAVAATHNTDINRFLTKDKDEKLTPVVQRIYVDRVRIGAASCGSAAATKTDDAGSGNSADSPGRLVRDDVERDTRALTEAVELDLATGRTCQAWGKANGFVP
jgi:prophage endopeptidase